MNHAEKNRFRQTVKWKRFRAQLIAENKKRNNGKIRCELFGTVLTPKRAQAHHRRPDLYDTLDPELFRILSPVGHDLVELVASMDQSHIPNREAMLAWLGPFLPASDRVTEKYYEMLRNRVDGGSGS